MTSSARLGVGIVGCGAITQAAHLPALAGLGDLFDIVHVSDIDAGLARAVADRVGGASASTTVDDLLSDSRVNVVAVCTPDRLHADVVAAACSAGVAAVLCEKPLAGTLEDADRIVAASTEYAVPVVVGTMHRYDPVVSSVLDDRPDLIANARLVRSTMHVPSNDRLIALASQPATPPPPPREPGPSPDPAVLRAVLAGAWASTTFVHHFPLLRAAGALDPEVAYAASLGLGGAEVALRWPGGVAMFTGVVHSAPLVDWSFEVWTSDAVLRFDFPPSFLGGRSASATIRQNGRLTRVPAQRETGYRAQWRHVARVARGEESPVTPASLAREDVRLAAQIAQVGRALAEGRAA